MGTALVLTHKDPQSCIWVSEDSSSRQFVNKDSSSFYVVLVLFGMVHPPAVFTSLIFAFRAQRAKTLLVFLLALVMVAVLYVLHRVGMALLHRLVYGS